jgi:predicted ATPase
MEKGIGHSDDCCEAAREVALHERSLDDKVPSWLAQIDVLGTQGEVNKAIVKATGLLNQLGQKFPKSPGKLAIVLEFVKTKVLLKGRSDDDLVFMPLMTDKKMKVIMELLARISQFAFHAGMIDHCTMACFRMMKLSLKHGLHCSHVFALYGKFVQSTCGDALWTFNGHPLAPKLVHIGAMCGCVALQGGGMAEYQEAHRFGELAKTTLHRFGEESRCRTMIVTTLFCSHLKQPFSHCLDPALEAYKSGMQVGDLNHGFCGTSGYLYLYLCVGLPMVRRQ